MGRVFFARPWPDDPRVPDQPNRVAVVIAGPLGTSIAGHKPHHADGESAHGVVAALAERMSVEISRVSAQPAGYHPTRSAELFIGGAVVGYSGEIHPEVAALFDIDARVALVEIDLAPLVAWRPPAPMLAVSTYPHVDFDLSFDVPQGLAGGDLLAATMDSSDILEDAAVFDDFLHPDTGRRSVAIRYRLRAPDRTLNRDEIEDERNAMVAAAAALGAKLRGN
jgi:phenylalanyl-tRNA synthetase beta chain